ncbi:hypothetical protein [Burkholderia sp. S171]|uniref:hypothetical protein n=1 Tax=Burkholderia sp. S171 TaxID=1641860 RepID=UPI00131E3723|nr:hypothetical protein [Burkholderia sp. S171]
MPKKIFDTTNERKLTDQDALVIRAVHLPRSPRFGSVILAQLFGVSQPTIDRVVKRETYRHLHPLLLPGFQLYGAGHEDLAESSAKFGWWAENKTAYRKMRVDIRNGFATGGYIYGLKGEYQETKVVGDYSYRARPVRRVINPDVEQMRRAKLRFAGLRQVFGEHFDEALGLAAAGLAPKLPPDEFKARMHEIQARRNPVGVPDALVLDIEARREELRKAFAANHS